VVRTPGAVLSSSVAVHPLWGDAGVVADERVAAPHQRSAGDRVRVAAKAVRQVGFAGSRASWPVRRRVPSRLRLWICRSDSMTFLPQSNSTVVSARILGDNL
jgi:hypothetical protein